MSAAGMLASLQAAQAQLTRAGQAEVVISVTATEARTAHQLWAGLSRLGCREGGCAPAGEEHRHALTSTLARASRQVLR